MSAAFRALARQAAALYPARDRYARHFAYGKLTPTSGSRIEILP